MLLKISMIMNGKKILIMEKSMNLEKKLYKSIINLWGHSLISVLLIYSLMWSHQFNSSPWLGWYIGHDEDVVLPNLQKKFAN